MEKPIISPITGSIDTKLSLLERLRLIRLSRNNSKKNKHKVIVPYNQHKDPYCTAFASAGCYTYNKGKKLTNEEIYEWANPILKGKGANTRRIVHRFAKDFGVDSKVITILSKEYEEIMNYGFGIVISTQCPTGFWQDGVTDGKVDGIDYIEDITMGHAVFIFRKEGKDYICNSWGKYQEKGFHNEYEVNIKEMFNDGLIDKYCTLIY